MIDIHLIAQKMSLKEPGTKVEMWSSAIKQALHDSSFSQMTDGEIDQFFNAIQNLQQLLNITKMFRRHFETMNQDYPFDFVSHHSNRGSYDLSQWLHALNLMYLSSEKLNQPFHLSVAIERIQVAIDRFGSGGGQSLVETLKKSGAI